MRGKHLEHAGAKVSNHMLQQSSLLLLFLHHLRLVLFYSVIMMEFSLKQPNPNECTIYSKHILLRHFKEKYLFDAFFHVNKKRQVWFIKLQLKTVSVVLF